MFRVALTRLLEIYLSLLLFTTFAVWLLFHWRRHRREILLQRHVVKCSLCGFHFRDPSDHPVSRCPQCERLTERRQAPQL